MMTEDEITREAKRNLRQGVPDVVDLHDIFDMAESEEERSHINAVAVKMRQLIMEGYQPAPMPDLGKPKRLESGDLRFLAKSDAMQARAKAALAGAAVQDWIYYNDEEDE